MAQVINTFRAEYPERFEELKETANVKFAANVKDTFSLEPDDGVAPADDKSAYILEEIMLQEAEVATRILAKSFGELFGEDRGFEWAQKFVAFNNRKNEKIDSQ